MERRWTKSKSRDQVLPFFFHLVGGGRPMADSLIFESEPDFEEALVAMDLESRGRRECSPGEEGGEESRYTDQSFYEVSIAAFRASSVNAHAVLFQPIKFGEFGKYMKNKRLKLQVQQSTVREEERAIGIERPQIFAGLVIHVSACRSFFCRFVRLWVDRSLPDTSSTAMQVDSPTQSYPSS
jgi:hypothetical protein